MKNGHLSRATSRIVKQKTGVVIPVYLPDGVNTGHGEALVRDTIESYCEAVENPASVCVSVDGEAHGAGFAKEMCRETGATGVVAPTNMGKFQAASLGVQALLKNEELQYIAIVDQDGDHFANELINLVRAAEHIAQTAHTNRLLILGQRNSRHHPMGFLRGELETLVDRILMDALMYHAALRGQPLPFEFADISGGIPDFHSGYKLFSRETARDVFLSTPEKSGCTDACYYRHAVEAVMTVEAIERGGRFGVVTRSTFNEQPISTFGLFKRDCLFADMIIWPCRRLNIPGRFVLQWFANYAPALLLGTLVPQGKEELETIRRLVEAAFPDAGPLSAPVEPLFV